MNCQIVWLVACFCIFIFISTTVCAPAHPLIYPDSPGVNRTGPQRHGPPRAVTPPGRVRPGPPGPPRGRADAPPPPPPPSPPRLEPIVVSSNSSVPLTSGFPCQVVNGLNFCEFVNDYPREMIRNLLQKDLEKYRGLFDDPDTYGRQPFSDDDVVEERVCPRESKIFYPKMAMTKTKDWVYVVNEVDYVQAVTSEICARENKACAYIQDNLPLGFQSRCRQRFAFKRLLAVHPTKKTMYADSFSFPSCCACYVKFPGTLEDGRSARRMETRSRKD